MSTVQDPVEALCAPPGEQLPILRNEPRVRAKGLAKGASWAGFLPGAIQQPDGIANAAAMAAKTLAQPASLLPMTVVSAAGVARVALGLWFALRELRLAGLQSRWAWRVPAILLAGAYSGVIFRWGNLL